MNGLFDKFVLFLIVLFLVNIFIWIPGAAVYEKRKKKKRRRN